MLVLGLNAFHADSAAALIVDGKLVAAVEEERFRRIKHWAGFPSEAIRYCLDSVGARVSDIDIVALNQDSRANLWKKVEFTARTRPGVGMILDKIKNKRERAGVLDHLAAAFPGESIRAVANPVEHHLAHLSSAFHVSGFSDAAVVSVDGFGDFASSAWGLGSGTQISVDGRVYFPHSLGIFYQALTTFLGFNHYGDEYKIMGLAPYGAPKYVSQLRRVVHLLDDGGFELDLRYFRHHREKDAYEWDGEAPTVGKLFDPELTELLGEARQPGEALDQRHRDIARSVQAVYEESFFHLLNTLHGRHGVDALAIAGGCGMNSVANGKVRRNTPFQKTYVQSAAGDAGGAIGAAFVTWYENNSSDADRFHMEHAYWGPAFEASEIADVLDSQLSALTEARCSIEQVEDEDQLCQRTALAISEGQVVGWFQGRMEWGPRALGNRSILGDPRRSDMKDILNLKIKRRESFRPFAPSILEEHVADWFEEDDNVPFMMKVFQIKADVREEIPAVTHVDGSGRLQTVSRRTNPRYHRLIECFNELSGLPMVLNTSFNENEPVVCHPREALDCFLRTNMDVLVLGDWYIERQSLQLNQDSP